MFGFENVGKFLILIGVFLTLFGVLFTFWHRMPFLGRLPGDIFFQKGDLSFFLPLMSSLVISLILTILLNLVLRLFR